MNEHTKVRVWDIPTRLFHWVLAALVSVSIYTGLDGGFEEMDYHMISGYSILGLVVFRVIWGFIGGHYARFCTFLRLGKVVPYTQNLFKRDQAPAAGHNPLGALSVLAMLLVLLTQAVTGLFANDDLFLEGPLVHLASDEFSDLMTTIHHYSVEALYVLIGLHLLAIVFYELFKRQRLILPMLTGHKQLPATSVTEISLMRELSSALILISALAGGVYYLVNFV